MEFDRIVRNGTVVDGTGAPARRADVGIRAGRIGVVGDLAGASSEDDIDARGLTITPGFIDTHAHSDFSPILTGLHPDVRLASIRQGVTTEVCGNCGFTPFPSIGGQAADVHRHVATLFGGHEMSGPLTHATYRGYRDSLEHLKMVGNLAPLVGHGTLRAGAIGFDRREATPGEIELMSRALEEAMDDGAFGLSSGLVYPPGLFSDTEELIALARVAGRHGGIYATHMRDEMDLVDRALDEALRIGRESGAGVQISHHKVAGRANWGRQNQTLRAIEHARATGLDVTLDVYPYTAGSTGLYAVLPPWAFEGGMDAMLARLKEPANRGQIRKDFATGIPGWQNLLSSTGWDAVVLASVVHAPELEGVSIAELAADQGRDEIDIVADLLIDGDASPLIVIHMMAEDDVRSILAQPYAMVGSDGIPLPGKQHPRLAGTFVRALGVYGRETGLLSFEECVRKMTSLPAEKFRLRDRGIVAIGKAADLVVLDPATVIDRATYVDPLLHPSGISHVLVNGEPVIRSGQDSGARAGRILSPV